MRGITQALAPYKVHDVGWCADSECDSLGAFTSHGIRLCKVHETEYDEILAAFEDHWEFGEH